MNTQTMFTSAERAWLSLAAGISLVGLNTAFLYGALMRPDILQATLANPIAMAFILEAFLLLALLAFLLRKWEVSAVPWPLFVLLSLIGGIAFALPAVLLWSARMRSAPSTHSP